MSQYSLIFEIKTKNVCSRSRVQFALTQLTDVCNYVTSFICLIMYVCVLCIVEIAQTNDKRS